jgi:hypothetical protein
MWWTSIASSTSSFERSRLYARLHQSVSTSNRVAAGKGVVEAQAHCWSVPSDELTHTIYLFLRTEPRRPYTYLGRLKYLAHDTEREHPVYFQWQLLDWSPPPVTVQRMDLALQMLPRGTRTPSWPETEATTAVASARLVIEDFHASHLRGRPGTTTRTFRAQRAADYAQVDAMNRALGHAGECLVLDYERHTLA